MKKILTLVLLLFAITNTVFAWTDPSYEMGKNIGNAMGDAMGKMPYRGDIEKSFYADDKFDFSTMKRFALLTTIPPQYQQYIDDQFIVLKYEQEIQKKLGKKYTVKTMRDVKDQYYKLHPETVTISADQQTNAIINFAKETNDTIIIANIQCYNASKGVVNVKVEFLISPLSTVQHVFNYTESRFNVENNSREGSINTILKHFCDKFEETIPQK